MECSVFVVVDVKNLCVVYYLVSVVMCCLLL